MLTPFCQQNDYGFALMIQIIDENGNPVNLANASVVSFILIAPDGTISTKTGTLYQGGIGGLLYYMLIAGDLAQFGEYTVQGAVSLPSGSVVSSARGKLRVYPNTAAN